MRHRTARCELGRATEPERAVRLMSLLATMIQLTRLRRTYVVVNVAQGILSFGDFGSKLPTHQDTFEFSLQIPPCRTPRAFVARGHCSNISSYLCSQVLKQDDPGWCSVMSHRCSMRA